MPSLNPGQFAGDPVHGELKRIEQLVAKKGLPSDNMAMLLPLLLQLRGARYNLDEHYQFEALHKTSIPKRLTIKGARQIGKTVFLAARGILLCALSKNPPIRMTYVTPLFEQVRRISNDYVAPMLNTATMRTTWVSRENERSVLRRSFHSGALMRFAYAFLSAEGLRGIDNDVMFIDEFQDFKLEHMGVVVPSLSASKIGSLLTTGTAKGTDTNLASSWNSSSQAEWVTKCGCGHMNIPALGFDLEKMIGPNRKTISKDAPGLVCAKCSRPIYPQHHGAWVHRKKDPEIIAMHPGYHIPQPIMHMHYSDRVKWSEINAARDLRNGFTPTRVKNEIYGEEAGSGIQLITSDELKRACDIPLKNNTKSMHAAVNYLQKIRNRYSMVLLAVDWGGGGETGESLTVAAVLGVTRPGIVEIVWGKRLYDPHDHIAEARELRRIFAAFGCQKVAHDFTGAGAVKEAILVSSGVKAAQLIPIRYASAAVAPLMSYCRPKRHAGARAHYMVDKTRSLVTTVTAIRTGRVKFFEYDWKSNDDVGLVSDFLALTDRKVTSERGNDVFLIGRMSGQSDDFAQAVNIGCMALWHATGTWPRLDVSEKYNVSEEVANDIAPEEWSDEFVTETVAE